MAYTKTQWVNNEEPSINATNLNKMEQGIADAQFPDGGSTGQILAKTNDGTGWVDAPTSAEWGNIEGQISEQTDLYSELESKITMPSGGTTGQVLTKTASGQAWQTPSGGGNVDTVNGISPDANKNVQTATDLTEAAYKALPSTKESDNVDYYLTDADSTIATAEDIPYDNTTSGMTATNVQGALDELANGLMSVGFSSPEIVTFPFTAPKSGMLLVQAGATSSSTGAYIYITDRTLNSQVITAYNLNGVPINQYYPCVKGHTYAVTYQSNVNNIVHRFFAMGN